MTTQKEKQVGHTPLVLRMLEVSNCDHRADEIVGELLYMLKTAERFMPELSELRKDTRAVIAKAEGRIA